MQGADKKSFLGTGWAFPPEFSNTSGITKLISAEEDIQSSLEVLLSTRVGERIMQPLFGCNLDVLLFEPIDTSLRSFVRDLVYTAIFNYEPRVTPVDVKLVAIPEEGKVLVHLDYVVRATNSRYNLVFPYYLTEGSK